MARREHDLNGADGIIIGAAYASTGRQYDEPPRATDAIPGQIYQDDDDIGPVTSPNLLVGRGRVTLTDAVVDDIEDDEDDVDELDDGVEEPPSNTPVVAREYHPPVDAPSNGASGTVDGLLGEDEAEDLRDRWPGIKATFVDDPIDSIRQADMLIREVTELVTRRLHDERARLGSLWESQEDTSTEDLRLALRGYQGFFDQLADAQRSSE